jgi:hypothetical protein
MVVPKKKEEQVQAEKKPRLVKGSRLVFQIVSLLGDSYSLCFFSSFLVFIFSFFFEDFGYVPPLFVLFISINLY